MSDTIKRLRELHAEVDAMTAGAMQLVPRREWPVELRRRERVRAAYREATHVRLPALLDCAEALEGWLNDDDQSPGRARGAKEQARAAHDRLEAMP